MAGAKELEKEVINAGLCTSCGACVGICPYINVVKDRTVIIEPCGITDGRCYTFCPRTFSDLSALSEMVFGSKRSDFTMGYYISVKMVQATDPEVRSSSQYGGVVSSLLSHALNTGLIDEAVLTNPFDNSFMPNPCIARNEDEVFKCGRSNYVASPTLKSLNEALKDADGGIGVVGTPCQVVAIRKMQMHDPSIEHIKFVIGLFCTWAMPYKDFYDYLSDKIDLDSVERLDIPPPPEETLVVTSGEEEVKFPLEDIREIVKEGCKICYDMTSEFADVSVGMVEGMDDWNTLIVRTERGARLVESAISEGVIRVEPLDDARHDHLQEASLNKKKRAIDAIENRNKKKENLSYLKISKEERDAVI
ncbi:MAG: Coenzyme F420 hydrogenase/dehydrogenase, beta subunit C-terminal domain [Halobacteriota archaeon]|nr:Coenzyme F420 hydrogenase/dehydrogenase, beta subunit C-terminal domain [Halobacteriota archaeon]